MYSLDALDGGFFFPSSLIDWISDYWLLCSDLIQFQQCKLLSTEDLNGIKKSLKLEPGYLPIYKWYL